MRNINVTKAAKRNAKSEAATVSFAEIGAALIATAAKPEAAKPEAAKPSDLPERQRAHLRALSRIFYAGDTQAVHTGKAAKPLSSYVAGTTGAGHQQSGLNDRTAALAACIHTAHGAGEYCPSKLGADVSKHTSLFLNGYIRLNADKSAFSLTPTGAAYAARQLAGKSVSVAALGDYPTA